MDRKGQNLDELNNFLTVGQKKRQSKKSERQSEKDGNILQNGEKTEEKN